MPRLEDIFLGFFSYSIAFLEAKPPLRHAVARHVVIFSKNAVLRGGLALVRNYCSQPQNHPDVTAKDSKGIIHVNKS